MRALNELSFDPHLPTTHGIDISTYTFAHPKKEGTQIELKVWDFGGQQIYHTTHQFFMTKRSLYLLVWNARGDTDQARLDHWLKNIQVIAPDSPVLLVATHIDERPEDFNFNRFKEAYPQLAGHIGISSKTGEGISELRELIAKHSLGLPLMEQEWPKSWSKAESSLKKMVGEKPQATAYTYLPTYLKTCEEAGVSSEIATDILGVYLHELGKIVFFSQDDVLRDFIVLKPNWLTEAISKVLDDTQTREQNKGFLAHEDFERIWAEYPRYLYPKFLHLMEKFLISYQVQREHPGQTPTHSLVPLLLPHSPPQDMSDWEKLVDSQPEIEMVFQLKNFTPPGIMSWFIVLTFRYNQAYFWREGVRLEYEGHHAEVVFNPSEAEIWLRVAGPAPSNFFNILQHILNDRVLAFYPGLTYERRIPCNCHRGRSEETPCSYFHDYKRLTQRMKQGKLDAECGVEPFDNVSVPELLEGIHYSTKDRVINKLEKIERNLLSGQEQIQTELITYTQNLELLRDWTTRFWKLHIANIQTQCPNTFILLPEDRKSYDPRNLFSNAFTLHLMCQHRKAPHVPKNCQGYPLNKPKDWWQKLAPWIKQISDYLRYIPKSGIFVKAYDEDFYHTIETSLQIFNTLLEELPDP